MPCVNRQLCKASYCRCCINATVQRSPSTQQPHCCRNQPFLPHPRSGISDGWSLQQAFTPVPLLIASPSSRRTPVLLLQQLLPLGPAWPSCAAAVRQQMRLRGCCACCWAWIRPSVQPLLRLQSHAARQSWCHHSCGCCAAAAAAVAALPAAASAALPAAVVAVAAAAALQAEVAAVAAAAAAAAAASAAVAAAVAAAAAAVLRLGHPAAPPAAPRAQSTQPCHPRSRR